MIPKSAVEKAIEGGWLGNTNRDLKVVIDRYNDVLTKRGRVIYYKKSQERIALDPTFWQALGKALGWPEKSEVYRRGKWLHQAVCFYDLILTGGDTEKFWAEVLTA